MLRVLTVWGMESLHKSQYIILKIYDSKNYKIFLLLWLPFIHKYQFHPYISFIFRCKNRISKSKIKSTIVGLTSVIDYGKLSFRTGAQFEIGKRMLNYIKTKNPNIEYKIREGTILLNL